METVLEIENVTKRFGGLAANQDVSFEIHRGEIVGLIGPNGAGKTTLFNCISGYYPPTSGVIKFEGENITGLKPHTVCKKGLARTFQLTETLRGMSVLENVMVGAFCRTTSVREARQQALKVLEITGLLGKKDVVGTGLTTPDRKRLEIARALATRPGLLMLDEAMAGLTPTEVLDAVELVKSLQEQGITLFIVEHVMEAIMPIADRVIVLEAGQKIAEGPPREIVNNEKVIQAYLGERRYARSE